MLRPLLVLTAHGLDLLTFVVVIGVMDISNEYNWLMRTLYLSFGLGGLVLLKTAGASALALCVAERRWPVVALYRFGLVPAVGAGILGTVVNSVAYAMGGPA